jgi:hypothetical protein
MEETGAYSFKDLEVIRVDFDGLQVSVATPKTLYLMKKGNCAPQGLG